MRGGAWQDQTRRAFVLLKANQSLSGDQFVGAFDGGVVRFLDMLRVFAATSVLTGDIFPACAMPRIVRQEMDAGDWHLSIWQDRFSGSVSCRLRARNHRARYEARAVGFSFGQHADVMEAVVRVDGGQPQRFRDFLPRLAELNLDVDGRNMTAPTNGIVWVPLEMMSRARWIWIQPVEGKRPRAFSISGLSDLQAFAKAKGCVSEAQFI